jgi:hypothetical protein
MRVLRWCAFIRARELRHLKAIRRAQQASFVNYDQSIMALIGTMTVTWAGIEMVMNPFDNLIG